MRPVFAISGRTSFPAVDGLVPQPQVLDGAQAKIMRYPLDTEPELKWLFCGQKPHFKTLKQPIGTALSVSSQTLAWSDPKCTTES
jgi:hypothetical protein